MIYMLSVSKIIKLLTSENRKGKHHKDLHDWHWGWNINIRKLSLGLFFISWSDKWYHLDGVLPVWMSNESFRQSILSQLIAEWVYIGHQVRSGVKSRSWVLRCHRCFHITTVLTVVCRDDIITICICIIHYVILTDSFPLVLILKYLFFVSCDTCQVVYKKKSKLSLKFYMEYINVKYTHTHNS